MTDTVCQFTDLLPGHGIDRYSMAVKIQLAIEVKQPAEDLTLAFSFAHR